MSHRSAHGLLVALIFALAACATLRNQETTEFWVEAANDPIVLVDPPSVLATDVTSVVVQGVVVDHRSTFETVADYTLELLQDDGATLVLHYAAGLGRRAPVERGQLARVRLFQQPDATAVPLSALTTASVMGPASAPQPLRALMIEVWRPGLYGSGRLPVLVVQVAGLIPRDRVPTPLRKLIPVDEIAYQASERLYGQCHRAVVHRQFAFDLDDGELLEKHDDSTMMPGARLTQGEGVERYDVLLMDNRTVLQTDCPDQQPEMWAWSALWQRAPVVVRKAAEPAPQSGDTTVRGGSAAGLPDAATPTGRPLSKSKLRLKKRVDKVPPPTAP